MLYLCRSEVTSQSSSGASRQSLQAGNWQTHHEDEGRSLGDLWGIDCRSLEGVAAGRWEPNYQHPRSYDP